VITATALLVGAVNFLPALTIGPILEHFSMQL
jgi:K+-transporting ATPase A subunit